MFPATLTDMSGIW